MHDDSSLFVCYYSVLPNTTIMKSLWMEQVCSKFSILVLFKKSAIWLTSLHLPTASLWFCTSQEVEPKNRCGWGPSNKNMGVTFSWLAPSLTVSYKSTVYNSPVLFYRAPPLHNLKSVKHKLLRLQLPEQSCTPEGGDPTGSGLWNAKCAKNQIFW